MATQFSMTRDINGYNGFGLKFAEDNYNTILSENVEQRFIIPASDRSDQKWLAIISFETGASVYVALNNTAEIPGGAFARSASQLNPIGREVKARVEAGDFLSCITANAKADVNVQLYAIQ